MFQRYLTRMSTLITSTLTYS